MAQRFIEFIMMQAQNAAFALGQIPHPETGEAPVNLDLARLFIDQLILIRTKTRGNLSNEELAILNNAISNLQMVFVEVSKGEPAGDDEPAAEAADAVAPEAQATPEIAATEPSPAAEPPQGDDSGRKKFTKSYGS
jgi:hypothetical protein